MRDQYKNISIDDAKILISPQCGNPSLQNAISLMCWLDVLLPSQVFDFSTSFCESGQCTCILSAGPIEIV